MCVNPYIAKRKDGTPVPVPCGKCLDCRKQYQNEWIFRLKQESKRVTFPAFVTLTYDDEHIPTMVNADTGELVGVVSKRDCQLFFKRLRKAGGVFTKDLRYYLVAEHGSKFNRPHYHALIFAPNIPNIAYLRGLVETTWQNGFVKVSFATDNNYHYVCKYMNKLDERPHLVKPFRLYSRSIGLNFLTDRMIEYYLTTFDNTCINGRYKIGLPRYFKRKLDTLSQCKVGFKEAGLCYSDLCPVIQPKVGSKFWFLKDFEQHFDEYFEAAKVVMHTVIDGIDYDNVLHVPTRQEVWRFYVRENKPLRDMIYDDSRQLLSCQIRNKLVGDVATSRDVVNSNILQE